MTRSWISCALSDCLHQDWGGQQHQLAMHSGIRLSFSDTLKIKKKEKKKVTKLFHFTQNTRCSSEKDLGIWERIRRRRHGASWGSVPLAPHRHPGAQHRPAAGNDRGRPVLAAGRGRPPAAAGGRERGRGRLVPAPGGLSRLSPGRDFPLAAAS